MMEEKQKRELYEGYLAMQHNPCWQWLSGEWQRRRDYACLRLRQAADWAEYCAIRSELAALEGMAARLRSIPAAFAADSLREEEKDGNELWPVDECF